MSHPNIRLLDRAKETTTTTGSGTISLGGAVAGFVAISGVGNSNSTYYTIQEGNNFEVGIGTYASGDNTLSRDEIFSSSNSDDSKIDLAGNATVFITYPAEKAVVETSGNYVGIGGIDPEYQLVVSGTGSFNTVRWADGTTQVTSATGDISIVSGLTVTNTTNIASTGATNASDIATVSGLLYDYWTVTDGDNSENISTTDSVKFTGGGATTVAYNTSTNTVTINTPSSEAGYDYWTATDGDSNSNITNNSIVKLTGAGNATVSLVSGNPSVYTISGSSDPGTTYTAGTGLSLAGTEFNVSGIDSTMIVDGTVSNTDLANSSITITAGTGLSNGGAVSLGGTVTLDADAGTTSASGIVQLQDAATDGTTDKAITPNAVYDISGVLASDIASTGSSNLSLIRSYIDTSDNATFNNVTAQGNLTVSGTLTYLDSTTVTIADKQLELASNSGTPIGNDSAVNDGGIVVKSTDSDKKWTWLDATDAWTSTENIKLNSDKKIIFGDSTEQTTSPTGDIATVSGLTVTNASNIASTGATNAANIATNTSNISTNTTNIASTGATNAADIDTVSGLLYDYWTLRGDAATTTNVDTTETVQFTGAGNTSVTLGGADNRVVTISGSGGGDTTYTAGTGLSLVDTEFNVSGIDSTMIVDGSVTNSDLQNSSITITAGTGLSNGGAVSLGASVTVDADTASTSQTGVVRLQDSATDGTTDRAITPNAVYDISGVLSTSINTNTTNIASTGATNAADINTVSGLLYGHWKLKGDGATTTNVDKTETVQFTGAGNTSVTLGGTDNRVVTISGSDSDTTYTAGTGLSLVGTEFNVSGIDGTMIVNGSISNSDLANSSITVTAGSGLEGGGSVSLGGTVTLDTAETGWFEKIGINDRTPDAMLDVVCASDTDVGLRIEMTAAGAANPFEIVRQDGSHRASIDTAGDLSCGAISGSGSTFTYGRIDISPTFRAATGANNLNIRNPNADKDINFDVNTTAGSITFRDYPNYTRYFSFNMGSDADGTGMYIRSRDDTSILTQWQSSGGTPVAMVNATGAISGQHFIFGDGTTQSTASAGGSSVSFGSDNQIPYMNAAGDDFDYESNLTWGHATNTLNIDGDLEIAAKIFHKDDSNTFLHFVGADDFRIVAGGDEYFSITHGDAEVCINEGGDAVDFRVEGDTDANLFFVDGSADKVGISNASPQYTIDVSGNARFTSGVSSTGLISAATGVELHVNTPVTTTNKLYNVGGVLYFNGSGVNSDSGGGGGGGSPGGSDTQVQFNDSSSFGGDSDLTWNKTTNVLTVAGHIAATTKSFLIDHPVKENKKLQYASLEGPENGVYVRGHTNSHVIELPDYWVALVDPESITVHLTPKGQPQPSLCVNRVSENKVYLSSDQYISAYYTVSATRKDVPPLEVEI